MSSVTMCGSSACTCFSASSPFRAVPTTWKPSQASIISVMTLRMNALSSTTSTVCRCVTRSEPQVAGLERPDEDRAIPQVEVHAAAMLAARVLADDRDAVPTKRLAGRRHVALTHVDAARGNQRCEHAPPPGDHGREMTLLAHRPHRVDQ